MGFGGISVWQLLIVLAIVIMIFGTKRLKSLGGDLGGAIKGFKKAINDDATPENKETINGIHNVNSMSNNKNNVL